MIEKINVSALPPQLKEIPQPIDTIYMRGKLPPIEHVYLSVVGSRSFTRYGKEVCEKLIAGLEGYPVVIVSGMAVGIDTIAHETAMKHKLTTVAFPGSGLSEEAIYPRSNKMLARKIIETGGCLLSEFPPDFKAEMWGFPKRNRLMAGISQAILVIEAEQKSGTLITARLGTEYNRDVLAVPGSIFSKTSIGTNFLIRLGATPITNAKDLLEALGFDISEESELQNKIESERQGTLFKECTDEEKKILKLLHDPLPKDQLIRKSGVDTKHIQAILSLMEIKGLIVEECGEIRSLM